MLLKGVSKRYHLSKKKDLGEYEGSNPYNWYKMLKIHVKPFDFNLFWGLKSIYVKLCTVNAFFYEEGWFFL